MPFVIRKTYYYRFGDDAPGCSMSDVGCQLQWQQMNIGSVPFSFGVATPLPPAAGRALNAIRNGIANDPNCANFLGSGASQALNEMQQNAGGSFLGTATIPARGNEVNGATTFGVVGVRTAINTVGAFYNSSYNGQSLTTDQGNISGGTAKAQAFILLHELGHILGVLEDDANVPDSQAAVNRNDQQLDKNCKKTVRSF